MGSDGCSDQVGSGDTPTSPRRFAYVVGRFTLALLATVALAAGWMLTMFDPQYEASPVAQRAIAAVFAGAFGVLVLSPIIAFIGAVAAGFAWLHAARVAR